MDGCSLCNPIVGLCMRLHLACNVPDTAPIQEIFGYCGMTKVIATPLYAAFYLHQCALLGHQLDDQDTPYSLSKDQLCCSWDIIEPPLTFWTPIPSGVHVSQCIREHKYVVQVYVDELAYVISKDCSHQPLKGWWSVAVTLLYHLTDEHP